MKAYLAGLLVLGALITSAVSAAQEAPPLPAKAPAAETPAGPPPPPAAAQDDPELNSLLETVMAARLAKELKLNDEQSVLMVRRLGEYRDQLADLRKQRSELTKELRGLVKAGAPDADIEPKLDNLMKLDRETVEIRQHAYEKAAQGLSTSQRAKLYLFVSEFQTEMKRLAQMARERARKNMGPPPPPGPDGPPPPGPGKMRGGPGKMRNPDAPPPPPAP